MSQDNYSRSVQTCLDCGVGVFDPDRDRVWKVICRYLQPYVPASGSVLDLGAGYCSFINNIAAKDKHAMDLYAGFTTHAAQGVRTRVGSCEDLNAYASESMDVIFASNLVEHLHKDEIDRMFDSVLKVLKPGGRLILIQPNFKYSYREYFDNYTHVSIFTEVSLADFLIVKGFEIEKIEARFLPTKMKSRFPKWPWLVALYLGLPVRPFAGQMLVIAKKSKSGSASHVER